MKTNHCLLHHYTGYCTICPEGNLDKSHSHKGKPLSQYHNYYFTALYISLVCSEIAFAGKGKTGSLEIVKSLSTFYYTTVYRVSI